MLQKVGGFVLFAAIAVGIFYYRSAQEERVTTEIEETAQLVVEHMQKLSCFEKHQDFLAESAEHADEVAMDAAYSPGGRRRSPSFDRDLYLETFMRTLKNAAQRRHPNDKELDQALRQMQIDLEQA